MGSQRTSFAKLQRDRAKKAKAAAKREMRQDKASAEPEEDVESDVEVSNGDQELSAPELLRLIEQIHQQYDAKQISMDDFEERKADLLSRLPID